MLSTNLFDSGPHIFRKSFEFQPNGNAIQPATMLNAVNSTKNNFICQLYNTIALGITVVYNVHRLSKYFIS